MDRVEHVSRRGSRVRPVSKSSWEIIFDWFEEGACIESVPEIDRSEPALTWSCECCEDGFVELTVKT